MEYYVDNINNIPKGKPKIIEINGRTVGIIRGEGNTLYAIKNICPHMQAPLCKGTIKGTMLPSNPGDYVYGLENKVIQCPWHGWEFNLETGEALFGISNRRVATYPIKELDGEVYVVI